MYYNRTISTDLAKLISPDGQLRWLFEFVKSRNDLDFLIQKNKSKECISIYRGLTKILSIQLRGKQSLIKISGDKKYKNLCPELFEEKNSTGLSQDSINRLIDKIASTKTLSGYYENKKEGYHQSIFSRKFGILSQANSDFVILDKEAVIGYKDKNEKDSSFGPVQKKYKLLQEKISKINAAEYGSHLETKSIGNEVDFIGVDKEGNILLVEYKHGINTSGIYLSPLQIGLYYDLFKSFSIEMLKYSLDSMLKQKKSIGLINPLWKQVSFKSIIPVLVISEYNKLSSAKNKFEEIMNICREEHGSQFLRNLKIFNYTQDNGLTDW